MVTIVMRRGHLRTAIEKELVARGESYRSIDHPDQADLFALAIDSRAIIHVVDRDVPLADVLRAMAAPGRRRLILVCAAATSGGVTEVRRSGVPYIVFKTPPLLEELGDRLVAAAPASLWYPSDARDHVVRSEDLARDIARAIDADSDGSLVEVAGEIVTRKQLVRPAGGALRTRSLPGPLYRVAVRLGLLRDPQPAGQV